MGALSGAIMAGVAAGVKAKGQRDQKQMAKKQMEKSEEAAEKAEATEIAKGRRDAEKKKDQSRAYASGRQSLLQGSGVKPSVLG